MRFTFQFLLTLGACMTLTVAQKPSTNVDQDPLLKFKTKDPIPTLPVNQEASKGQEVSTLSYNEESILLLKKSLLKIPKIYESRFNNSSQKTTFISVKEFLVKNRSWITTLEITTNQAAGSEPLSESVAKMIQNSSNVIIAVKNGNPVTFKKQ